MRIVLLAAISLSLTGCLSVERPDLTGSVSQVSTESVSEANANPLRVRNAIDNERAVNAFFPEIPVGSVIAFVPFGDLRLPENWRYANGDVVDDPKSPLYGRKLPLLMDGRFLMGSMGQVGASGGSNQILPEGPHNHQGLTGEPIEDWRRTGPPTTNAGIESFNYTPGSSTQEIRVPEQGHRQSLVPHQHELEMEAEHDHGGDKRPSWAGVAYIVRIK